MPGLVTFELTIAYLTAMKSENNFDFHRGNTLGVRDVFQQWN